MKFEKWQFAFGDSGMCMLHWKTSGDENGQQLLREEKGLRNQNIIYFGYILVLAHSHGMWKLPDRGSNLHHSSDPSHCSDNTRSLTWPGTRELCHCHFRAQVYMALITGSHLDHFSESGPSAPQLGCRHSVQPLRRGFTLGAVNT